MLFSRLAKFFRHQRLKEQRAFWVLVGLSGALIGAMLLDVYVEDWTRPADPLWLTVLENSVPALLALTLPVVGWLLFRGRGHSEYLVEGAKWALLGGGGTVLLAGLVVGLQILQRELNPHVIVLHMTTLGALGGMLIGLSIARWRTYRQRLHEEQDRFENLFDSLPAPVVRGTLDGDRLIVSAVNPAFERVFGYRAEEILGADLHDVIVPEGEVKRAAEITREAIEEGPTEKKVRRLARGGPRDFHVQAAPVLSRDSAETYAIYTDITEREQYLRETRRRSDAIEAATDGIAILDSEGIYTYVNQSHAEIYGYESPEAFLEGSWKLCYDGEELRRLEEEVMPTLFEEGSWRGRAQGQKADGTLFPQELALNTLESGGLVCVVRDITRQVAREQELQVAKEKAEEASRLKSAMLANVSHEIRTPLTAITGYADLLRDDLKGASKEFADKIHLSSERLMSTLDSILQLSELEAGTQSLDREAVPLGKIVNQVAEMIGPQAEQKSQTLKTHCPDRPVVGQWNEDATFRICRNLVENAVKFTPEEGRIEVRVETDQDSAVLEVADTGVGMDPSRVPELFGAFRQESQGLDREYEGSGLGLSIVDRLTSELGGDVEVETEKGEGTCFRVRLPMEPS